MNRIARALLAAACLLAAAPASAAVAPEGWDAFLARLSTEAARGSLPKMPAKLLGLGGARPARVLEAAPADSGDARERAVYLLADKSVVFKAYHRDLRLWRVQRDLLRLGPDGVPRKAVTGAGEILVTGADKAPAVKRALTGPPDPQTCPAAAVRPVDGTVVWWLDQAAAELLGAWGLS